eukprot:UN13212
MRKRYQFFLRFVLVFLFLVFSLSVSYR